MKILNLYAGIGGNRKLWGDEHEITAVEYKQEIANIYQQFFPNDKIVVGDAHQYLLEHYQEFDFIWSSPPCPSHSRLRKSLSMASGSKAIFPDMKLYEEILFLQGYFKGKWCVENVKSWYEPLIKPQEIQRHYFWTNFEIPPKNFKKDQIRITGGRNLKEGEAIKIMEDNLGIDLSKIKVSNKRLFLRNCVNPEVGKYILDNCPII
jgi:DNA (cytosine-5)-methyltransferase 1